MKVINISTALVKDENLFKEYLAKAAVLMKQQKVEVICKGKYIEAIRGPEMASHITAVFKYKNRAAFDYFYGCPSYKEIIPLRDKACEMTIQIYSEL